MTIRKVAATRVYLNTLEFRTNHVVELADGIVATHYPLTAEQPQTEWLGGTIIICNQCAYHTKKVLTTEETASASFSSMTRL